MYTLIRFGVFWGFFAFFRFWGCCFFFSINLSLLLSLVFEHGCLDTSCFRCLICICFIFLYLHLFSAVEHVSHGGAL